MDGAGGADAAQGAVAVRVLHVDPERGWGGGEVQVMALLGELGRRGHASRVAAHPDGPLARAATAAGVPVIPLAVANHVDIGAALRLRRALGDAEVVHFHTARAHALAPLCRRAGVQAARVPRPTALHPPLLRSGVHPCGRRSLPTVPHPRPHVHRDDAA